MASPHDRKYLQTHEWHKPEGGVVIIGLTKFAVDELTDITYVDIAKAQGAINAGDSFGEIESVKATSDMSAGSMASSLKSTNSSSTTPRSSTKTHSTGAG